MVHEFERLRRGEIASEHLQSLASPSLEQQLGSCIYLRVYEVTNLSCPGFKKKPVAILPWNAFR
jgi:hypothetical protein